MESRAVHSNNHLVDEDGGGGEGGGGGGLIAKANGHGRAERAASKLVPAYSVWRLAGRGCGERVTDRHVGAGGC